MKKYLVLAIIAIGSFTVSCTADNDFLPSSKSNFDNQEFDYSLIQKEGDTIGEGDTGGQGGSTPIKP